MMEGEEQKRNQPEQNKVAPKRSIVKRILGIAAWIVATPIILIFTLIGLLYVPAVQQWAVDTATSVLSEQMGMDVKVGEVRLKFPLDLSLRQMSATEEGDTVVNAKELIVSVRLKPLLKQEVEVDGITLRDATVDTRGLIEAMRLEGHVGELSLNSHTTSLERSEAVVSYAMLADTDLSITMGDSVAEDTSKTADPLPWKIRLDDVRLKNVGVKMALAPQSDSIAVGVKVGDAHVTGLLDLGEERYDVHKLSIGNTSVAYDMGGSTPMEGMLDPQHIALTGVGVSIDSLTYKGKTGEMGLQLNRLVAKERSGLEIVEGHTNVKMDSVSLSVSDLLFRTRNSILTAEAEMDMNAFEEVSPGNLSVDADVSLGWKDLDLALGTQFAGATQEKQDTTFSLTQKKTANTVLPPVSANIKAHGNMKRMSVSNLSASMLGAFSLRAKAEATNITDADNMGVNTRMKADVMDVDFVKNWMPADVASSFTIPKNMMLLADAKLANGVASLDANLHAADALLMLTANYGIKTEGYKADVDLSNFVLNKIIPLEERLDITGSISAKGRGFDIYSPATWTDMELLLDTARMGQIDVSGTNAHLTLKNGEFGLDMACENNVLQTVLDLKGKLNRQNLSADLNINLPFSDFKAMGLSERTLELSTNGKAKMSYNWDDLFMIDSYVEGIDMRIGKETLLTDDFYIYAESMPDSTVATIRTGDFDFDFQSPNNLFSLIETGVEIGETAMKQIEEKKLDFEVLKAQMPVANLRTDIGKENPISKVLEVNGLKFDNIVANLNSSPEMGLRGWAHVHGLRTDSIELDTAYFSLVQDTTTLVYKAGVKCQDQKLCPGFSAYLDGFLGLSDADAHITFFNKKGNKGVDLGVKAFFTDSTTHFSLYPAEPTIAFNQFNINQDNYVSLDREGRIFANIFLDSKKDDCNIILQAEPQEERLQDARISVENLNLGELLTVVPFVPNMDGMINFNANYVQTPENFSVNGDMIANEFKYENSRVGNLGATFDYTPVGETAHDVKAALSHNGAEIVEVKGIYDGENEGNLDALLLLKSLPMSIASAFIPDQMAELAGHINGELSAQGAIDKLNVNGSIEPENVRMTSEPYALDMRFANTPILIKDSRLTFNRFEMYGIGDNPLTLNGYVDFADLNEMMLNLSLYGKNFQLTDAKRTRKSVIFGKMYGDFFARVNGTSNDLSVRGMVSILNNTDMTYVMADTPLSIDYRLEDIVTFVDFNAPPDTSSVREARSFMGMDMRLDLMIEDGAKFRCEFSADRQSYVNVQGGGSLVMTYTPEAVLKLQGRYTVNEGEMKYTLPVIPLKTFTIENGSYIDFTGEPLNPTLNIAATERTKASVSSEDGSSRSVAFDVGLKVTNTLSNMGLEFTISAPEDLSIQNELAGMSLEEKNKLAVAMLATGMYLSGSNSKGFSAGNALNNFLQNEINNIAGQALNTAIEVNVGMEQSKRDDGSTRTDYSFKFSKRFFSDRLNIVIGGKISADNNETANESGAYIDDVSLEWRLDDGGTRYIRIFHEKNYDNLIEGELIENGAGVVLRKKLDRLSDLFIFKKK